MAWNFVEEDDRMKGIWFSVRRGQESLPEEYECAVSNERIEARTNVD